MNAQKRQRRTYEEVIADLHKKIEEVQARAAAKAMKTSPTAAATLKAIKSIDKALEIAAEEGASALRGVLTDARKPIAEFLEGQGAKLPKARTARGPRAKAPRQ